MIVTLDQVGRAGRTVDPNGVLLQTSVSQLEMVDTRNGGCMRKWWYRYVAHLREPETDDTRRGTLMHAHLERFVRTGVLPPSPSTFPPDTIERLACEMAHKVIASGLAPLPGTDILCEQRIEEWGFTVGPGIKMTGVIDYLHGRDRNTGVMDIEDSINPPGTIVVGDYKSKNSKATVDRTVKYLPDGDALTRSIQMAGYGIAGAQRFGAQQVRLEHVYAFTERPNPRKVTRLTVLDPLLRTWEYAGGLARGIRDAACERNVDKVDANRFACDKYTSKNDPLKHRCMHAPYCSAYGSNSLSFILGETASKDVKMSLMQTIQPPPGATPGINLAAEEAALRAQQASIAAGGPANGVDDATFADAWRHILAAGQGQPTLGYPASQVYARLCGTTIAFGGGYAGTGALGQVNAHEPMQVLQIASDLGWRRAAPQPAPAPVMQAAPVQPAPQMQSAPAPVMQTTPQMVVQAPLQSAPIVNAPSGVPSILAPDAPSSNPALAMAPPKPLVAETFTAQVVNSGGTVVASAPVQVQSPTEPAPKRRRGRPAGSGKAADAAPAPVVGHLPSGEPVEQGYALEVFVDCHVAGGADSLDDYINFTVNTLVAKFCPPPAIPDLRAAPADGPLGYGKWKAALAATVREVPPSHGRYVLHTGGDEIRNEVANALRAVCLTAGGLFVDGRR